MTSDQPSISPDILPVLAGCQQFSELIRRCLAEGLAGPWKELLAVARPLVESTFLRSVHAKYADLAEFHDWFGAWLVQGKKLKRLAEAMERPAKGGEAWSDKAVESYFRRIVKSARGAFYRERLNHCRLPDLAAVHDDEDSFTDGYHDWSWKCDPSPCDREFPTIRAALERLPIEKRVLLRLKYYREMGPLPQEELEWVAGKSRRPVNEIHQAIVDEFDRHCDAKFPLSAKFIGDLLDIPPDDKERYTAVDKRLQRMREAACHIYDSMVRDWHETHSPPPTDTLLVEFRRLWRQNPCPGREEPHG